MPLFKDGNREELDNYWGVALSCVVGKVEQVLEQIRAISEKRVMEEAQGGEEDVQIRFLY